MIGISVAVVEDDPAVRELLAQWLRADKRFDCVGELGTGTDAVSSLPKLRPNVVLMDINLPVPNGIECVRLLKPRMPETQFVMLTIYADSTHIFDALAAGACGYMLKKLRRTTLYEAIEETHAGGSPMSCSIARKVVESFQQRPTTKLPEDWELSRRQQEVLRLLTRGYLYKEIADTLNISQFTVNGHIRQIYEKLHVRTRGQVMAKLAGGTLVVGG